MTLRRTWLCGLIVSGGVIAAAIDAEAQSYNSYPQGATGGSTGTSTSMFGSSTGTGGGRGNTGSSAFGGSSMGSTGQQGLGQIGFGNTGQTGQNRNTTGGAQGQNGFLGVNNNPNSFLGRNTQGQQANQGQQGQRNNRGGQRGLDQELQNLLNGNGQFGGNNANASKSTGVRPRQKVAFEHPTLQTPAIVTGLTDRFGKLAVRFPHLKNVDLSVEDNGVVVLRGNVESEHAAKLTENLVRLEPGVKSIRSELSFPPPAAAQ